MLISINTFDIFTVSFSMHVNQSTHQNCEQIGFLHTFFRKGLQESLMVAVCVFDTLVASIISVSLCAVSVAKLYMATLYTTMFTSLAIGQLAGRNADD
jgi:hypothetical protein